MSAKATPQTEPAAIIQALLAAQDDATRRALISQHASLDWDQVVCALSDQARLEIHVDLASAQKAADAAMFIAQAIGSNLALARSRRAQGNVLYATDQHAAALEMHRSAAGLFEAIGEKEELARTLSSSIQPFLLLGKYDEAIAAGEHARRIFAAAGNRLRLARLDINIGNVYQRQDRFEEALAYYRRAYDVLITQDDGEGLAAVLSNLSLCHIFLNDFSKALEFHQKARRHCEAKNMPILVAYADYNLAYLYFLRGEYGRAIKMLRAAASGAQNAPDAYQLALCDLDLAEIYVELNLSEEAGELARRAHGAFRKLGFGYEAAKALAFEAIAASRQGQAFEGLKLFNQAREIFVADKNQVWPSLIDLYKALLLFNEGRLFEARQLSITAHEFFSGSSLKRKAVLAQLLLARILAAMNDLGGARHHCRTALEHITELESPMLVYDAEFLLGEIKRRSGELDGAYEGYSRARTALESLRGNLRGEELKLAFFNNKLEVYEHLVDLCLRRPNGLAEAFACIEQAKSRILSEALSQRVHASAEADTGQSELVRSIRNLREELNWYYNLIEREQLRPEENSPARIQDFERQAKERENTLLRSLQQATDLEANEAGFQRAVGTVSIEKVRAALPAETTLVEYFCVQDRVLACALDHNNLQVVPVTLQSRVQKLLQLLQFQLSKFRLDPEYVRTFHDAFLEATQAHLQNLYQELIAPLENSLDHKHVVFVPHGLLHYVPMHALFDGQSYLIDRCSVSYAPSATVFAMCQNRNPSTSSRSLIMGIADAQAPSILEEIRELKSSLPQAQLFVGEKATQAVLRQYGPHSRIVHIATHGYFRQDNPMFSSIRLGDSYLSLYDLYHLHLPVELVVLSGCATGMNVIKPGDEQIGLVRGLLQAGAQSMILSLWDVHDASTKEFMVAFYDRFQSGSGKPLALQKAMIELRKRYPHPYYWAPFLFIGKV
jgi:CHAT domain-containing protein/tetratricopeptide (TPR) repeat protein